jgi:ectoine hydroxylase-related dioxygenase (phytanoyl-CoA dioxygenase family)
MPYGYQGKDLSSIHHPISNLFSRPQPEKDREQYKLGKEQVDFFHEFGYVAGIKLLDDEQIKVLRDELNELTDPQHPGNGLFHEFHSNESSDPDTVLFHALGHWRITTGFHDLLWNPAFVMAAQQLLRGPVRFWHDQLFYKPARHGGVVAWHQDYSYWTRTKPLSHLTCWCGLDDSDANNGCLYYIPGSHRWGLVDKPELAGDMEGVKQFLTEEQKDSFNPAPIELKAGYATFHHPLLMHGSYANKTPRPRRAFVVNAFKDGVYSDADTELLKGVPVIPKGKKVEGRFFPVLSDL